LPRKKLPRKVGRAPTLRAAMSLPEVLLWQQLRGSEAKFRRQHPLGPYVLDFYCAKARVCVEVDGISHNTSDRPQRDAERDEWLKGRGIDVVRIPASEVLADPAAVAEVLVRYCRR
jgi:very-short-patch-repair endonuclease